MPKTKLTDRQDEVYRFLLKFNAENGYHASRQDICDHFDFSSKKAAADHLEALKKKGVISISPNISRGIKILKFIPDNKD